MQSVRDATISGINEQIQSMVKASEKHDDQEFFLTLVTFSCPDDIRTVFKNKNVNDVIELTENDYAPDGSTALNDAICNSIEELRASVSADLLNKDNKVVVSVFTDGWENSSQRFSHDHTAGLIKELQGTDQWTFSYIGANQDVYKISKSYNIPASNSMRYSSSVIGTQSAFRNLAATTAHYATARSQNLDVVENFINPDSDEIVDLEEEGK